MTEVTECPQCGKKGLVKRNADLFQCLCCEFKRDFNEHKVSSTSNDGLILIMLAIAGLLVLLLQSCTVSSPSGIAPLLPEVSDVS